MTFWQFFFYYIGTRFLVWLFWAVLGPESEKT